MARGYRDIAFASALALASLALPGGARGVTADAEHFARIKTLADRGGSAELLKETRDFRKKYPSSPHLGEVRFLEAEHERNPSAAVAAYRAAAEKLPEQKASLARSRACGVLYLSSRWNELYAESRAALKLHGSGPRAAEFMLHQARACIFTEKYERAARLCGEITRVSHDYGDLSSALLILSHIERKTTGYSRSYFATLRDLITGFPGSAIAPTALYLLGKSYQDRGDPGRAHSAYSEITRKYPRSPESVYASERLASLARQPITPADHMPTDDMLKSMDAIDLGSEKDIQERHDDSPGPLYSISLGPVESAKDARRVANLVKGDFGPVRIVNLGGRYAVYAGRLGDTRSAMTMKIRLAEEMGLNGRIVRIVRDDRKTYIYGD